MGFFGTVFLSAITAFVVWFVLEVTRTGPKHNR
jgi:hypothetical protein